MAVTQKKQIEILKKEIEILKSLPLKYMEVMEQKIAYAQGQYRKFCDDMIKDNNYTNRLNAAVERQKIRDFQAAAEYLVKVGENLPDLEDEI